MTEPQDLREGDEVRLDFQEYPGVYVAGPVARDKEGCCLHVGPHRLTLRGASSVPDGAVLTITKHAPRPFYVNHVREEPVHGDVARHADTTVRTTWVFSGGRWYNSTTGQPDLDPPKKLRLLVDGDTGQTVPA